MGFIQPIVGMEYFWDNYQLVSSCPQAVHFVYWFASIFLVEVGHLLVFYIY